MLPQSGPPGIPVLKLKNSPYPLSEKFPKIPVPLSIKLNYHCQLTCLYGPYGYDLHDVENLQLAWYKLSI